jgi:nucleotide-binding universal stress UspA family protein
VDERPATVLYCYDGAEFTRHALVTASGLLVAHRSVVLCVWRSLWATVMGPPLSGFPSDIPEAADHAARQRCQEIAEEGARLVPGSRAVIAAGRQSIWRAILDTAEEVDAGLIVVGSRGRSEIRSAVLGSVSHGLVNHSHRPVLVVPPIG